MMKISSRGAAIAEAAQGGVRLVPHAGAIEEVQDVEPILEWNKSVQGMPQKSDWGRHIARIPNVILCRWYHEELDRGNVHLKMFGPEMDKIIMKKLNDPDWRWLRVDI